ncbi:MAG: ComF family protein [Thiotrichales bacterium]|nr:ComF family protein [Thiotrichales bacterium]
MAVNFLTSLLVNCARGGAPTLFPNRCRLCDQQTAEHSGLCLACQNDLPLIRHACPRCATPLLTPVVCGACLSTAEPPWRYCLAAFDYGYPIDRLIGRMKFEGEYNIAGTLGMIAARNLRSRAPETATPDVILPVPLHPVRRISRGYNQAAIIAQTFQSVLKTNVDPRLARRLSNTPAQSGLNANRRQRNLHNVFACRPELCRGRNILIVDDVITTGATVRSLARQLHLAGANRVAVWALAKQRKNV